MTRFQFRNHTKPVPVSSAWKRRAGLAWLCLWLCVAGGFGYRHLTHETPGEVQASVAGPSKTKPIEQIQVGERVAFAINPTETLDTTFSFDINPKTWRKITLRTAEHEVVLLRPATWINEHLASGSSNMMLTVPEIGIDEPAELVSIWPCPSVRPGEVRIVIGTFTHIAPETICMHLEGLEEPIRCTPNHITWSVEHRDFVEAHELQPGHLVLCDDGVRTITRVDRIEEPIRVYNLEVQGQHVYQVSQPGMLVHNASPIGDGASLPSNAANELANLNRMKQIVHRELQRGDLDDAVRLMRQQDMATINERIAAAAELMRKIIFAPALPN